MDTFRDRDGNINIHGDHDNNANLNADCNGNCHAQGNGYVRGGVQGNLQGDSDVKLQGNVDSKINAKLNGNVGLNFNLNFGLRRTNDKQCSYIIFVPVEESTGVENLNSFGYSKNYALFCIRNNVYE